ncbi:MAG TPA: hypothetical protein VEI73_15305 [Candidatus Acidoferrum sp.]|nr:hypothetical protein [Candidatus Acidoferrum sp.]
MIMKSGEHWHCTNAACRCAAFVEKTGNVEGPNPRCVCGSAMKKNYTAPVFGYLDFLQSREPALSLKNAEKE